jgi:hypothetical protein
MDQIYNHQNMKLVSKYNKNNATSEVFNWWHFVSCGMVVTKYRILAAGKGSILQG